MYLKFCNKLSPFDYMSLKVIFENKEEIAAVGLLCSGIYDEKQ